MTHHLSELDMVDRVVEWIGRDLYRRLRVRDLEWLHGLMCAGYDRPTLGRVAAAIDRANRRDGRPVTDGGVDAAVFRGCDRQGPYR